MSKKFSNGPSQDALSVLGLLKDHHNVLISGPPASGKSLLLAEVAYWFKELSKPAYSATNADPFPNSGGPSVRVPSPECKTRYCFSMTFHQNTKYRDFVRGLLPDPGGSPHSFRLVDGMFLNAAEAAAQDDTAALLTIDEINRGPAVSVFGDLIGALEREKRLDSSGAITDTSQPISLLTSAGTFESYYVPYPLYLLGAMNEADTSVEGLDVAFRRRFSPYRLVPQPAIARQYLSLAAEPSEVPEVGNTTSHVLEALIQAWQKLNRSVSLTRGKEYQLGHGIFFELPPPSQEDFDAGTRYAVRIFERLQDHLFETYYGDTRLLGALLAAGSTGTPFQIREESVGGVLGIEIDADPTVRPSNIFDTLRAIAIS